MIFHFISFAFHFHFHLNHFHPKDHLKGHVIPEAQRYQAPPAAVQYGKGTGSGTLPLDDVSFIQLSCDNTIVNCVKKAADNDEIIVRLTNPTDEAIDEDIRFCHPVAEAWLTNLNEEKNEKLKLTGNNRLKLKIPPYRIMTVRAACMPSNS